MASQERPEGRGQERVSLFAQPKTRGLFFQAIAVLGLVALVWWLVDNTIENLARLHIASGFGFLRGRAGFDIGSSAIAYSADSSYARAIVVGLINTVIVAVCCTITATAIGFIVGIGRLARNGLVRKFCAAYVELFRNIPPLLVIFFWYFGVLSVLPLPRDSVELPLGTYLNSRGLYFPKAVFGDGTEWMLPAFLLGVVLAWLLTRRAKARQMKTGQRPAVLPLAIGLIVGLPGLVFILSGFPLTFEIPQQSTFNLTGGFLIKPEFLSLYLALSLYSAAFIAEIVRAGILSVSKGQAEASYSLGLKPRQALRLVVVPQAMRIIIPPLTSQYLNLTKNSSLAIAIGYPDLTSTAGTVLNQTGQAIECVVIMMVVYLAISLLTSLLMNWFNTKMALIER